MNRITVILERFLFKTFARVCGERNTGETPLTEAGNEANSGLFASFPTKSSWIYFLPHSLEGLGRAKCKHSALEFMKLLESIFLIKNQSASF